MTNGKPEPGGPRPLDPVERRAIALSLVASLGVAAAHFASIFPMVQNFPKWDQWSMIPTWHAHFQGDGMLTELLRPYNGHYNVIPRMIFYGLGLVTSWNVRVEVVLSYLAALATLAILIAMLADSGKRFVGLAWIAALQVFSIKQFENYMSGYPFGQVLSQMAATFTVFILTRRELERRHVALAAVAAVVATFSWGAGLAACCAGLLALLLRGRRYPLLIAAWIAGTGVVAAVVWSGAHSGGSAAGLLDAGIDPVLFALTVLGNPLTLAAFAEVENALWLGAAICSAFVVSLAAAWRLGRRNLALRWGLLGLMTLGACLLIGLGRSGSGPEQALASHYVTAAYPLTLATIVLAVSSLLAIARRRGGTARWVAAAAAALLLAGATAQPVLVSVRSLQTVQSWQPSVVAATERAIDGELSDDEIRRFLHPNPTLVRNGLVLMERHRLSCFTPR